MTSPFPEAGTGLVSEPGRQTSLSFIARSSKEKIDGTERNFGPLQFGTEAVPRVLNWIAIEELSNIFAPARAVSTMVSFMSLGLRSFNRGAALFPD